MAGKGLATMTATTVGLDWGMAALGITATPRKARVTAVRAEGLTDRYGEHAAIRILSVDRQRDTPRPLEPFGTTISSAVAMLIRQRQEPPAVTDLLPRPDVDADRPEVIHSVHGMTSSGDWFLLADVREAQPFGDRLSQVGEHFNCDIAAPWLVVAGGCVRDMINSDALDPSPGLAH